jgi:hypothetical protein
MLSWLIPKKGHKRAAIIRSFTLDMFKDNFFIMMVRVYRVWNRKLTG